MLLDSLLSSLYQSRFEETIWAHFVTKISISAWQNRVSIKYLVIPLTMEEITFIAPHKDQTQISKGIIWYRLVSFHLSAIRRPGIKKIKVYELAGVARMYIVATSFKKFHVCLYHHVNQTWIISMSSYQMDRSINYSYGRVCFICADGHGLMITI